MTFVSLAPLLVLSRLRVLYIYIYIRYITSAVSAIIRLLVSSSDASIMNVKVDES